MTTDTTQAALDRLRAAILGDAALQAALDAYDDVDAFAAQAMAVAEARGIGLTREILLPALRDDPLGLARWRNARLTAMPPPGWLPARIPRVDGEFCIDWVHFGAQDLTESFFEESVRRALMRPLNRFVRCCTRLRDLPQAVAQLPTLAPSGFVFHMSRCGSTLASRMLSTDPRHVVVSEPAPLDAVMLLDNPLRPGAMQAALVQAMILALGHKRGARQSRYFVKFDTWHTLALPMLRRAFPQVPWIFLYREPGEVLASRMRTEGVLAMPEHLLPPGEAALSAEMHCARTLTGTCAAAIAAFAQGGGLLVNYRELPQALWSRILPHFGVATGEMERTAMAAAARFDAKAPDKLFAPDSDSKQLLLTPPQRAAVAGELAAVYAELEALRLGSVALPRDGS
jgi:hypothetical protein